MLSGNVNLPQELIPELEEVARTENRTADEVVAEAVREHLVRRFWERNKAEASKRRGGMSDAEVEQVVDRIVHESRTGTRTP